MSVTVSPSDVGYATLYDHWVSEGSPTRSVERLGEHGGELWRILIEAGIPTFLLHAAAGPTDPGYSKTHYWDWASQSQGYIVEMNDSGIRIEDGKSGHENDFQIKRNAFPKDETVWSPS